MEAGRTSSATRGRTGLRWTLGAIALAVVLPATALAHVERPSYWPDPASETVDGSPAGGGVPEARPLTASTVQEEGVYIVCQEDSLDLAKASISKAQKKGFKIIPTAKKKKLSKAKAKAARKLNTDLYDECSYDEIQPAVNDAGNNDRVVVMPGHYTEPTSRTAPTNDPACDEYELAGGALSYEYHTVCPNDQSLVFVQGRALGAEDPPDPALEDRHGIPDEGECVRCNLQIEGSGVLPNDVLLDAATDPESTELKELGVPFKDVGMRVDRADGLVVKNMTFAHAHEHGIYIMETDGFLVEDTKYFYNGEYGSLIFNSDHGLTDTCEGMGHGDSAIYPGSAADSGEDAADDNPVFYPDADRTSIVFKNCDIHHNTLGYSGTMGNATQVTKSHFWDNGTAITTDSLYAGGHPGFPQDSAEFDNNEIWSNNFNSFEEDSDVVPKVPVPVGVGIFIAGGNNNDIHDNRIWDNWKRGTMLLTLPDPLFGRDTVLNTTSHRNEYFDNVMGKDLDNKKDPNGVDFWWDGANPYPDVMESGVQDNCWYDNGKFTSDPPPPTVPNANEPGMLPGGCENDTDDDDSYDLHYFGKLATELLPCEGAISNGEFDPEECHWFVTPPEPSPRKAKASVSPKHLAQGIESLGFDCSLVGGTESCAAFDGRP